MYSILLEPSSAYSLEGHGTVRHASHLWPIVVSAVIPLLLLPIREKEEKNDSADMGISDMAYIYVLQNQVYKALHI